MMEPLLQHLIAFMDLVVDQRPTLASEISQKFSLASQPIGAKHYCVV